VEDSQVIAGDAFMLVNQSGIALPLYNDALATNPNDSVLLKKKAEALLRSGQTGESEIIYQNLLSSDPNDPEVLVRMGDFSLWNGNYTGSIAYYNSALSIKPKNAQILIRDGDANLLLAASQYQEQNAVVLETLDSYRRAMDDYAQAEKLDLRLSAVVSARTLAIDNYQASGDYNSLVAALRSPS